MEEKTKASKGALVTKAGTVSDQSPNVAQSPHWDPATASRTEIPQAEACLDNGLETDPPSTALAAQGDPKDHQVIGEQIGRRLRTVYNDILAQPVPDRFLDLLRELEKDSK